MPLQWRTNPVKDTVPQTNNELAVGEDLDFQRKWWRFEHAVWLLFTVIILLDLLGVFGRGYFADADLRAANGTIEIKYERVERLGTPSMLSVQFGPGAVRDGKVQLWVGNALVKSLGVKRVIPQPSTSVIGNDGILYTFPVDGNLASVDFELQPASIGFQQFRMWGLGSEELRSNIFVMP